MIVRAALVDALRSYLATANPLADHPSVRLVEAALRDEERAVEWGRAAAAAVPAPGDWPARIAALLAAAGGLLGDARGGRGAAAICAAPPARRSPTASCAATSASSTRSTSRR